MASSCLKGGAMFLFGSLSIVGVGIFLLKSSVTRKTGTCYN